MSQQKDDIRDAEGREVLPAPSDPNAPLTGAALIADYVSRLPDLPGVYRMLGAEGDLLYVGKAKNLKNRVTSYTRLQGNSNRIQRMITQTHAMEFIVTETETESLLLEANLIKKLKPHFNILLKDDKSHPYILIARDHDAPQIAVHRGSKKRKGDYFGPFASAGAVRRTIETLQKAFLLRDCKNSEYESRTRPCLRHQIKRCAAPCTGEVSLQDYEALSQDAVEFLRGKSNDIVKRLGEEMDSASKDMAYEQAAGLRDRIRALTTVRESQNINPGTVSDADVFGLAIEGGQCCIQAFFFRGGQNWGNHAYYPSQIADASAEEILQNFMAQFYDKREPPKLILTSHILPEIKLLSEALALKYNKTIDCHTPQRGEKKDLVGHAVMNARQALGRKLAETNSQKRLLENVQSTFDLTALPRRIEVYDNSHISGSNALGGMIVSGPEGLEKNQYRKFNIKDPTITNDDFGMMREVFTRRFERLLKEEKPTSPNWPSMVVVDGGKGQFSAALDILLGLGLTVGPDIEKGDIMLVCIAKGRREDGRGQKRANRSMGDVAEQFFTRSNMGDASGGFNLPPKSPVLYYLQNLRDEAHRFAIGSHRTRRSKQMHSNPLDDVPGIGAKRKKALLQHFGSAKAVAGAKPVDLARVDGISKATAQQIYDHFH